MDDNNIYNNKNNNQDAFEQAARQQAAMQEEQAQLRGQPPVWETQAPPVNNQWEAQPAASQEPQQPIHQTERPPVYEPEQRTPYQIPVRDSREVQPPCQTQSSVPPQEGGFRESPYQSSASQQTSASQQWQSQQAPKPPKKKKGKRIAIAFGGVAAAALLFFGGAAAGSMMGDFDTALPNPDRTVRDYNRAVAQGRRKHPRRRDLRAGRPVGRFHHRNQPDLKRRLAWFGHCHDRGRLHRHQQPRHRGYG